METAATPGGIRITEALKKELSGYKDVHFSRAIECEIKGKGLMKTFEVKHQES
jgi:class 3 adenylate cyclase